MRLRGDRGIHDHRREKRREIQRHQRGHGRHHQHEPAARRGEAGAILRPGRCPVFPRPNHASGIHRRFVQILLYVAQVGLKSFLVANDDESDGYLGIAPVISPDGKHVAYLGMNNGVVTVVLDGKAAPIEGQNSQQGGCHLRVGLYGRPAAPGSAHQQAPKFMSMALTSKRAPPARPGNTCSARIVSICCSPGIPPPITSAVRDFPRQQAQSLQGRVFPTRSGRRFRRTASTFSGSGTDRPKLPMIWTTVFFM